MMRVSSKPAKTAAKLALSVSLILIALPAQAATEVAKVNGHSITDRDVMAALGQFNDGQRKELLRDGNTKRQVLGQVIEQELLVREAEKEKLDQDQEYKEALATFRRGFLTDRLLTKQLGAKVTESAAKKYYEAHKNNYSTAQVQAMHILVTDEAEAKELLKKAKETGADFQALAEKHSKDPSAKNNRGDLGFFARDRMVAEFTDAAFGASVGDIVGPVKTAYGYHIIKVVKKRDGKPLEYGEVELRVKNELKNQLIANYIDQLKSGAKIQVDDKALDKL